MKVPWLSLGGCFDYTHWEDRERFVELDKAIALEPEPPQPPYRRPERFEDDRETITTWDLERLILGTIH